MGNPRFVGLLTLILCLGLVGVEARGDGAPPMDSQMFFAQLRSEAASKPVARRPARPSGIAGEKSTCTAQCGSGMSVTVNCAGSCTATDRNCSISQRGYAQCTGGSAVYCADPCPSSCSAETPCPSGGSVWCQGTDNCQGGPGLCFVVCDGNFTWCPGETGFFC